MTERIKSSLRQRAEQARENRGTPAQAPPPPIVEHEIKDWRVEDIYRLLDLCKNRDIFLVISVLPQWYGGLNVLQKDLENTSDDPYLTLLQDLNRQSNCTVVICRDFEEITNAGTDEDYLFDYGHMTRKGAVVYTNWLVDRLFDEPKTADLIHRLQEQ